VSPDPVLAAVSTGEAITFWVFAPLAAIAAVMMVLSRKAVHAALFLAAVMLCLAGLYAAQDAPFLAAAQVIVYTGAVLMLFLFVLMLVGVDSSDSLLETLRGQRAAAVVVGLGFAALVMAAVYRATHGLHAVGLGQAQKDGNVQALARLLFVKYVFAFEITSALLITAALGAMVLAHRERTTPKPTQRQLAKKRFTERDPFPLPGPGVYALHHSNATPALLPDGSPAPGSVSPSLESTPAGDDGTVVQS
jgi:NADH-quinone oxidoreductase subunit J